MEWDLGALKLLARNSTVPGIALNDAISKIEELNKCLEWSLDLLDMYDERMIQLGDPPELVYSEVHKKGKSKARKALK